MKTRSAPVIITLTTLFLTLDSGQIFPTHLHMS
jgi:hypothetical protein